MYPTKKTAKMQKYIWRLDFVFLTELIIASSSKAEQEFVS